MWVIKATNPDFDSDSAKPHKGGRYRSRRWHFDFRLVLGILIIVVSVLGVFWVLNLNNQSTTVLSAGKVLLPGTRISAADLVPVNVELGKVGAGYLKAGSVPEGGLVVTRTIGSGEIVPLSAVGESQTESFTTVVIKVSGQLSESVTPGQPVDVWATNKQEQMVSPPTVIVSDARVVRIVKDDGIVRNGNVSIELLIPRDRVARLLEALALESTVSVVPSALSLGG